MILAILVFVTAVILSTFDNKEHVYVCLLALCLGSFGAVYATKQNWGIEEFELDKGISIRQDSTSKSDVRTFFIYHNSRSHQGGGLAGGK